VAAALALPGALALRHRLAAPDAGSLADYGTVPDFELVERSGRAVRRSDLAGRPWIADFVFTRCSGVCPLLSARMAKLEAELEARPGDRARLVSISVDPAHDTPAALTEYAGRFARSSDRWLFLTGPVADVRRLVTDGFHLAAADASGAGDPGALTHSDRVALVDPSLTIRRYYFGTDERWVEEALADLDRLARETPS
jgi:protein SCO1/2